MRRDSKASSLHFGGSRFSRFEGFGGSEVRQVRVRKFQGSMVLYILRGAWHDQTPRIACRTVEPANLRTRSDRTSNHRTFEHAPIEPSNPSNPSNLGCHRPLTAPVSVVRGTVISA